MEKIRIKELIEFHNRSEKNKKNFAIKLKTRKPKEKNEEDSDGGGDYWITSTSCIQNVAKNGNKDLYEEKIEELYTRFDNSEDKRIKTMYQRNIDILNSFTELDLDEIKPQSECIFQSVPKQFRIIEIENFPLFVNPNLLFTFNKQEKKYIGAIWLVPQLNGFIKNELGIFCEVLFKFLLEKYSQEYQISEEFCIVIDTFNTNIINYNDIKNGNITPLLKDTLSELKNM